MKGASFTLVLMSFACSLMAFGYEPNLMLNQVTSPQVISFGEALRLALARNEGLKKAEQNVNSAQGTSLFSASKLLPNFSGKAFHVSGTEANASTEHAFVGLNVNAPLFDARALFDLKSKREFYMSAKENYLKERDQLLHDVGALYIEAAIAQALSQNTNEEWEVAKKQQAILERKSKVGNARNLDVRRAQYLSAKAHSDYLMKRQEFHNKMGQLGIKIGVYDFFLLSNFVVSSSHLSKPAQELIDMARSSPDVTVLKKDISAADFAVISERFDFLPKVQASLDGGWSLPSVGNRIERPTDPFGVKMMLNLELPLFSGGGSLAAIKTATAKRTIAELSLSVRLSEKTMGITSVLSELDDLAIMETNARIAVDAATLAKESADRLFDKNEATGLELTEANSNLFSAKNLFENTRLRLEHAKLRLLLLIGKIGDIMEQT